MSSLALNKGVPHALFTNADSLSIAGRDVVRDLDRIGVVTIRRPLTYKVPGTWQASFRNQFYLFDILSVLGSMGGFDHALVADSDCVWVDSFARISESLEGSECALMEIPYEPDKVVNGLSRDELRPLMDRLGMQPKLAGPPSYFGGECVVFSREMCNRISLRAMEVFATLVELHRADHRVVCEEAHLLAMVMAESSINYVDLRPLVKRIWTSRRFRNATDADLSLALWHLPAEKKFGFMRLYRRLAAHPDLLEGLARDKRLELLGSYFGVPKQSLTRRFLDDMERVAQRCGLSFVR
jgi:hypothetical protein